MFTIRPIQRQDNAALAEIIRQVSAEFGLAAESGYAVADTTLDQLFEVYQQPFSQYWVIIDHQEKIYGGGGIAPLKGAQDVLEIQKMYFSPPIRRQGWAKIILEKSFKFAEIHHFNKIYLETTQSLWQAVNLYEQLGFKHLAFPMGNTGHSAACEIRMLKLL